jgi:hypothetical protein
MIGKLTEAHYDSGVCGTYVAYVFFIEGGTGEHKPNCWGELRARFSVENDPGLKLGTLYSEGELLAILNGASDPHSQSTL